MKANAPHDTDSGRRKSTRSSLYWSTASVYATRAVRLIGTVVLARLLVPEDFGIMAMAWAFVAFIANFARLGLPAHVIRLRNIDHTTLSTVFWINGAVGVLVAGITIAAAPLASVVYGDLRVGQVLAALSLVSLTIGITPVPAGLLRREMRFAELAVLECGQALVEVSVAIVMATLGCGVWALASGALAGRLAYVYLIYRIQPFFPALRWSSSAAREAIDFASGMLGTSLSSVLARNLDNVLVGAALGAHRLGVYSLATRLMRMPGEDLVGALVRVLIPRLACAENDEEMASLVRRAVGASACLVGPLFAAGAVTAPWLLPIAFGSKWAGAVLLFQILAPAAVIQATLQVPVQLYIVKGRTRLMFAWTALYTFACICALLSGLPFGLPGVAAAYSLVHLLLAYPWLRMAKLALPCLDVGTLTRDLIRHGLIASVAAIVGSAVVHALRFPVSPPLRYIAGGIAVLASSAALYFTTRPVGMDDLLSLVFPRGARRQRVAALAKHDALQGAATPER